MHSLKDKIALVTGGANGIGANIVKEFVKEQAKFVAILDVDEVSGISLVNNVNAEYGREVAGFFKCDVTNDDVLHGVFDKLIEVFGAIDVVVNNAAVVTETLNTYKKLININFTATVSSTLKALELMRADRGGAGGTIINISSIDALVLMSPSIFIYAATKSAVLHLSVCMGQEDYYRHTKVRVLTICFGATDTEMYNKVESFDEIAQQATAKTIEYFIKEKLNQSANGAAIGMVEVYKTGKSGSSWLVNQENATDISNRVFDAFKILSADIKL